MVFFCIPKTEPSIKILPKKKLKDDIKECSIKKENEVINQNNLGPYKISYLNSVVHEKSNVIIEQITSNNTCKFDNLKSDRCEKDNEVIDDYLKKNTINKEIKIEYNFIPPSVTVNNVPPNIDNKCDQCQQIPTESEEKLFNKSSIINSEFSDNCNQSYNNQESSDKINKQIIKKDFIYDLDFSNISNKKQCDNQSTSLRSTTVDCISKTTTTDNSTSYENKIIKIENTEDLPKRLMDVRKQNENKSEKQSINKWTIDEDKIILQTCKRVEDIEVLLETINRRIPQRSVSEVS